MYRKRDRNQQHIDDFILPFGGELRADNRWVKLAGILPWDFIEDQYVEGMNQENGAPAISARIAFGAVYIKENEGLTDERTLAYITENPYMQYFLGLQEYQTEPLFDASMMVHFRKRFSAEKIEAINKRIFIKANTKDSRDGGDMPSDSDGCRGTGDLLGADRGAGDSPNGDGRVPNRGKLILDATCAPADIRYPSDLSVLNEARENLEQMIEELWEYGPREGHKTRYHRKKARSQYLSIAKQKRPRTKKKRMVIRQQLGYVRSNLEIIGELLLVAGLDILPNKRIERIMTICELYRQQHTMYTDKSHSCNARIVSLRQPHVRPIVRGKAGRRYEFGQKISLSVVSGYTFIEKQSFDNFNEGISLIESVERYNELHGCYPEAVQADKIYRNRGNLSFCKERGIRLSGPRLGRPGKDAERDREIERQDNRERNTIEGRNGMAKRRFGLDLIMALLPETAMTEAALQVLCMNVRIRLLLLRFWRFCFSWRSLTDWAFNGLPLPCS